MKKSSLSRGCGVESATQPLSSIWPVVGEPVDALVRAAVLRHRVVLHEPVALQARERRVDLARVQRRQHRAELLLQRLLELIPMSRAAGEQCEQRKPHLDTRYTYRVSSCQTTLGPGTFRSARGTHQQGAAMGPGRRRRRSSRVTIQLTFRRRRPRRGGRRPSRRCRWGRGRRRAGRRRSSRRRRGGAAGRDVSPQVVKVSASARLRREPPASARSSASRSRTPSIAGTARASISAARPEAAASSWVWPSRPKPVTSVSAWAPAARACCAARSLSVVMTSIAALDQLRRGQAALERGRDRARAERLGEHEHVARAPAGVGEDRARVDGAGDREAVLGLGVVDRVPADDRGARLGDRVGAAAQDLAQHVRPERLQRIGDEVQRADRHAAHRVDVRQRVRGRDPPERVRVVDDRREEVDRLHDRELLGELDDARVVGGVGRDEHARVGRARAARRRSGADRRRTACSRSPRRGSAK